MAKYDHWGKKIMKSSHGSAEIGSQGRTLINRIETQMDKRRQAMEKIVIETGLTDTSPKWVLNRGRYEGFAGALAILRTTSVQEEVNRSNDRLGIS